ncbi:MarR family winged helix-turn-helix transcriptional regulator [Caulobacter soli]|uniref:MarR family winged helix-turn-helix transcriptional regulator n=1 Tax=Caulobacter soli TaxID=2708539 RepID=UPI0013ECD8EF|nr:MarR family transcriptional regulator [Caulobacter soli]
MPAKPRAPVDQLEAGSAFFAGLGLDVRHFGPMWHVMKVAQLVETELNRIAGQHGLSIADFHLLGALMMDAEKPLRPTDLALALNVSNAALTARIRKLSDAGLVLGRKGEGDRRATVLSLTAKGSETVLAIGAAIEREGHFVRYFRGLPAEDQRVLGRVMGELHTLMDRHFLPASRSDPLGG